MTALPAIADAPAAAAPIPSWPLYLWLDVTADGDVISHQNWRGKGQRVLRQKLNGYPIVTLNIGGGKRKDIPVHRIVAAKYLPPRPTDQHQIRHLNGVKSDCRADNLAWGTPQENINDRAAHGHTTCGESVHTSKLTSGQIIEIRSFDRHVSHASLAAVFDVTPEQISNIRRRKNWKHIP